MDANGLELLLSDAALSGEGAGERARWIAAIDELIRCDFHRLVLLLYRIDVPEAKLKATLAAHPDRNASELIADLIFARLEEKRRSREQFRQDPDSIPEEERW